MASGLIGLIIWLIILGVVVALVYYVADAIPIPAPLNRVIKVAVMVLACIVVILLLLELVGVSTGVNVPAIAD